MAIPNYVKSEDELNDLPVDWERHPDREKWAVLEAPDGRKITYHMSARSYRFEGQRETTSAAPELMYKRVFLDESPDLVPFGSHEGHSVEWLAQERPEYAEWMLGVAKKDWLREALEEELGKAQDEKETESHSAGVSAE
jgi:hypothetical protein